MKSRRQTNDPGVEAKLAPYSGVGTKLVTLERLVVVIALGAAVWFAIGLLFAAGFVNTGGAHLR
jgi:hypothetical protein